MAETGWTDEELQELEDRPIMPERSEDFTDEQFERRLRMAKKLWASIEQQDPNMSEWVREIYAIVPPWAIYRSEDNGEGFVRRVCAAHTATLGVDIVSAFPETNIVGALHLSEIAHRRVRRVMAEGVAHTATPGLFIDPLGFYPLMLDHAQAVDDNNDEK